jgi:hypothetical protein
MSYVPQGAHQSSGHQFAALSATVLFGLADPPSWEQEPAKALLRIHESHFHR